MQKRSLRFGGAVLSSAHRRDLRFERGLTEGRQATKRNKESVSFRKNEPIEIEDEEDEEDEE